MQLEMHRNSYTQALSSAQPRSLQPRVWAPPVGKSLLLILSCMTADSTSLFHKVCAEYIIKYVLAPSFMHLLLKIFRWNTAFSTMYFTTTIFRKFDKWTFSFVNLQYKRNDGHLGGLCVWAISQLNRYKLQTKFFNIHICLPNIGEVCDHPLWHHKATFLYYKTV